MAVLKLPTFRKRAGDLSLLIDTFVDRINRESKGSYQCEHKTFYASAKNILLQQDGPRIIRELINTMTKETVWSVGLMIDDIDIRDSLLATLRINATSDSIPDQSIEEGIDLPAIIQTVTSHYFKRACNKPMKTIPKHLNYLEYQTNRL